jgi:hypothetical protein
MIRNDDLCKWVIAPQDDMAAHLTLELKAGFFQGFDAITTSDPRQFAHTATRRALK